MEIDIRDLSKEITKALKIYTTEVTEGLEEAKVEVAKKVVKKLKVKSNKLSGSYSKGWGRKKVGSAQVIHNRTDYQLTHLLEYGHVIKNKYGTYGRVKAYPHIRPAEQEAIDEYVKRVEKVIKR